MAQKVSLMLLYSSMPVDTRVRKEALSLATQGILVYVICYSLSSKKSLHDNIKILPFKFDSNTRGGGSPLSIFSIINFWWFTLITVTSLKINSYKPIIHCHDSTTLIPGMLIKLRFPRFMMVYDSHESAIDSIGENFGIIFTVVTYFIELLSFQVIDLIITVSPMQKYVIRTRYKFLAPPIVLVRNLPYKTELVRYTRQEGERILEDYGISIDDRLKIIYATFIGVNRGLPELLDAWDVVERDDILLILAGDGPLREFVEDKISELSNFHYLGYLEAEKYYAVLKTCDIGLSLIDIDSNLNKKIGYPNKITEYLACGVIPLSTKLKNFTPEFARGQAIPLDNLSSTDLANALEELDKEKIKNYRLENRDTINSRYLWENDEQNLFAVYDL